MSEENEIDPFGPTTAPGLSLIMQFRIYDLLMAILREQNPDVAREMLTLHATGAVAGPSPNFNGIFLTDEMNPGGALDPDNRTE